MNSRSYHMTARAASAARTGDRILDAARSLWAETSFDGLRLDALAERAGVTVPTVVRRFDGKAGVIVALVERELAALADARGARADDPTDVVIADLVDHYERTGRMILKMYAEASAVPGLDEVARRARAYHVRWCREVFAPRMGDLDDAARRRRSAALVAVCDATTWRILRDDGALSSGETRDALLELVEPLLAST